MKIAQTVLLICGVFLSLSTACVLAINLMTEPERTNEYGALFYGDAGSQARPWIYWFLGMLLFFVAAVVNRINMALATSIGSTALYLSLYGGVSFIIFYPPGWLKVGMNLATSCLCMLALSLLTRDDRRNASIQPIYDKGVSPKPVVREPIPPRPSKE